MSIKIELLNRYQLRAKTQDLLVLPVIEIKPADGANIPFVSRINITVGGVPEDLAIAIQSAYKSVAFSTNKLLKLSTPQRLKQANCHWYQPIQAGVNCTMLVTVEYFESDAENNPILTVMKKTTAECNIWTFAAESSRFVQMTAKLIPPEPMPIKSHLTYPGWFAIDFGGGR